MTTIDRQLQNTLYTWLCHQQRAQTQLPGGVNLAYDPTVPSLTLSRLGRVEKDTIFGAPTTGDVDRIIYAMRRALGLRHFLHPAAVPAIIPGPLLREPHAKNKRTTWLLYRLTWQPPGGEK